MHNRARSWTAGFETSDGLRDDFARLLARRNESSSNRVVATMEQGARTGIRAIFTHQAKSFFLLVLAWIAFVLYIRLPRAGDHELFSKVAKESSAANTWPSLSPASLHLLVPASKASPNLCKLMVSAGIAGYPAPVLLNWDQDHGDEDFVEGESHLAKIRNVHEYLDLLHPSQDDDLVLVIDGTDAWLQLRAQTLIERYFEINRRADARIVANIGPAALEKNDIRQRIIFGAQKSCSPWTTDDPPCHAVPQSTIPKDGFEAAQPRYLNSGVAIGTAKAMRKLFKQALEYLPTDTNVGSDQYILSQILNDQETWREAIRRDNSWVSDSSGTAFSSDSIEKVRTKAADKEDGSLEFGIGLDFESEISFSADSSDGNTAWTRWDDETESDGLQNHAQTTLPSDILSSPPPFWTFNFEPRLQTSRWIPWSNVSLLTTTNSKAVPAVIHHNGRESLLGDWGRMWFSPLTRTMYDLTIYEPIAPLTTRTGYDEASRRDYWPSERGKGGAVNAGEWVGFDAVCNDWHEEVFGDQLGPYIVPEHH